MNSLTNSKIQPTHLQRKATVYLRQSTVKQVHEHRESTARQYALRQRAQELGWELNNIDVIDDDLGESGSNTERRSGFQRLGEDVAHGRVGAIFALEVSRLARSCADWHKLLDLCSISDVVIADELSVYSPADHNDRLLLGFKGTMSEAELYWIKLRLQGGKLNKARRGDLYFQPPGGYEWDPITSRFRLDPDEQVQTAIQLVFDRFRISGSSYSVMRYFAERGLKLPIRDLHTNELKWKHPNEYSMRDIVHNPAYAGAYTYGRSERRTTMANGEVRRYRKRLPRNEWKICLLDHHPAYISWEEFMDNENKLYENRNRITSPDQRGAAREGHALLQVLVLCGKCGCRMNVGYPGRRRHVTYRCINSDHTKSIARNVPRCWNVTGYAIDDAVEKLFLETVNVPEIELGLAVVRETERQAAEIDRQWKLRIEQAQYEAKIVERRYKAIDPDNRVVARTLEREWNEKLKDLEELEQERDKVRQREKVELNDDDRARILSLSKDLKQVWRAETTTHAERKNLLRMLVREITLTPIDVPHRETRVQLLWQTGAIRDFKVPRPSGRRVHSTSPEARQLISKFLEEGKTTSETAIEMNRQGLCTGRKNPWSADAVGAIRRQQQKKLHSATINNLNHPTLGAL